MASPKPAPSPVKHAYPAWVVPLGLVLAIFLAFAWIQTAWVQPFTLQAFALGVLAFFAVKFLTKRKIFSFLPDPYSVEIIPLAFSLLLLIGSTGGADSAFFPFMYVLLLLLVLSTGFYTTIIASSASMWFVYATSVLDSTTYWQALLSIPLMVAFFMYTEYQLSLSRSRAAKLVTEHERLESAQTHITQLDDFLKHFLKPKLISLISLGKQQDTPKTTLISQLDLLLSEAEKIEEKMASSFLDDSKKID